MKSARASVLPAGLIAIQAFADRFPSQHLLITKHSMREGAILASLAA